VGVVVEGHFEGDVFMSDNVLVRHSEVYEADHGAIDVEALRESLK
jgi:cytochrome c-type biogenesis protein CcmE